MNEYDLLLREDLSSEKLLNAHSKMILNHISGKYNYDNWKWVKSPNNSEEKIIAINGDYYDHYKASDGASYFLLLEIIVISFLSLLVYGLGALIYNYTLNEHWKGLLFTISIISVFVIMPSTMMPGTLSSIINESQYFHNKIDKNFKNAVNKHTLMSLDLSGVSEETQQNIVNFLNIYKDFGSSKNYNYVMNDLVKGKKSSLEIEEKYSPKVINAPGTYKMFALKQLDEKEAKDLKIIDLRAQKYQVSFSQ